MRSLAFLTGLPIQGSYNQERALAERSGAA
jgi:hypothetical protein